MQAPPGFRIRNGQGNDCAKISSSVSGPHSSAVDVRTQQSRDNGVTVRGKKFLEIGPAVSIDRKKERRHSIVKHHELPLNTSGSSCAGIEIGVAAHDVAGGKSGEVSIQRSASPTPANAFTTATALMP
jgi:hypothetical protein